MENSAVWREWGQSPQRMMIMIQNGDWCQTILGLQALPSMCSQYTKLPSHKISGHNAPTRGEALRVRCHHFYSILLLWTFLSFFRPGWSPFLLKLIVVNLYWSASRPQLSWLQLFSLLTTTKQTNFHLYSHKQSQNLSLWIPTSIMCYFIIS
jgi:hypothetical protein